MTCNASYQTNVTIDTENSNNENKLISLFDFIYLRRESGEGADDYEDDSREESSSEALHKWVNLKGMLSRHIIIGIF